MEKYSVLFVDDEENILNSLRRGLIDEDYRCLFASSGQAALEIMEKENVHVIVSDMRMPEMNGLTLLKIVKEKYPKVIRIVLSGYTQLQQVLATINQADIFKFITKPWKLEDEFKGIIRQALDYYKIQEEREELKHTLQAKKLAYQNIISHFSNIILYTQKQGEAFEFGASQAFEYLLHGLDNGISREEIRERTLAASQFFNHTIQYSMEEPKEIKVKEIGIRLKETISNINGVDFVEYEDIDIENTIEMNYSLLQSIIVEAVNSSIGLNYKRKVKLIIRGDETDKLFKLKILLAVTRIEDNIDTDLDFKKIPMNSSQMLRLLIDSIIKIWNGTYICMDEHNRVLHKFEIEI